MKAFGSFFSKSSEKTPVKQSSQSTKTSNTSPNRNNQQISHDEVGMVAIIDENERWTIDKGWHYSNLQVSNGDPMRYKSSAGQSATFPDPPLANGWVYNGRWEVERLQGSEIPESWDPEWIYGMSFEDIENGVVSHSPFSNSNSRHVVRRKRWIRSVQAINNDAVNEFQSAMNRMKISQEQRSQQNLKEIDEVTESIGKDEDSDAESAIGDNMSILGGMDAKFEIEEENESNTIDMYSDTESQYEPGKSFSMPSTNRRNSSSFFGSSPNTKTSSSSYNSAMLNLRDPTILAIGKQLKIIETEIKSYIDSDLADWKKYNKPALTIQINELEKVCTNLQARIEATVHKGLEFVSKLEDELKHYTNRLEDVKRKYYFPESSLTLGGNGIYVGFDDFWLENASGYFEIDLIPSKDIPQIKMLVCGTNNNKTSYKSPQPVSASSASKDGINIRLKVDGFKLAGDKGKRVPKIKFESLKVTVSVRASILLNFDIKSSKWIVSNSNNFKLELLSFKGPFGINRSMVGAILTMLTPLVRSKILQALPAELGLFMRTLPSPFSMRGEFDISGPELSVLYMPFEQSPLLCQIFEYTPYQMEMFKALQKSMERTKPIRTITDLLLYIKLYSKNKEGWSAVIAMWNKAAKMFSDKVNEDQGLTNLNQAAISFNSFLTISEDFRKKRICAYFKLNYMDGQISLNQALRYGHQLYHRISTEEAIKQNNNAVKQARLMMLLSKIQNNYESGLEIIKLISKNFDFGQLQVKGMLDAGPNGKLSVVASDIMCQLPLVLSLMLSKEKNLGHPPLVPYIISIKPQENGDMFIEIYHFSKEGIEASRPGDYKLKAIGSSMPSSLTDNITTIAQQSIQTIKKGVAITSQTLQEGFKEGLAIIEDNLSLTTSNLTSWTAGTSNNSPPSNKYTNPTGSSLNANKRSKQLQETLNEMPKGEIADTIVVTTVSQPHISLIVDKPVTLKPGAEIFTFMMGQRDKDWKPFGSESFSSPQKQYQDDAVSNNGEKSDVDEGEMPPGCPILVQTSNGVKLMNNIKKVEVIVNLPGLVRFIGAHFDDIDALKAFIEKFVGAEIYEEHLQISKMILDRIAKYLLLPGLNIDINLNGKLVALNNEIMISIETPDFTHEVHAKSNSPVSNNAVPIRGTGPSALLNRQFNLPKADEFCALTLRAEVNLMDILEDSLAVGQSLQAVSDL